MAPRLHTINHNCRNARTAATTGLARDVGLASRVMKRTTAMNALAKQQRNRSEKKLALIYCRVSTKDQADGGSSLDTQADPASSMPNRLAMKWAESQRKLTLELNFMTAQNLPATVPTSKPESFRRSSRTRQTGFQEILFTLLSWLKNASE